jgi:hypothetical protein
MYFTSTKIDLRLETLLQASKSFVHLTGVSSAISTLIIQQIAPHYTILFFTILLERAERVVLA